MQTKAVFFGTLMASLLAATLSFAAPPKKAPADTLFAKTVWHKKVSHLVIEETGDFYKVTLLMIEPHPENYKSQNYPLYYKYDTFSEAFEKLTWLDNFLKANGVLRIHIFGSEIIRDEILSPPQSRPGA